MSNDESWKERLKGKMEKLVQSPASGIVVPKGTDGWWYTSYLLPDDCEFCDGENGTPDLRDLAFRSPQGERVVPFRHKPSLE
jgi:hypothetical protein